MNCMKCGKETEGANVFCGACLAEMARYPVKPGTTVQIPVRPERTERKPARVKKERPPEEQIASLHKLVQRLGVLVVCLATALAVALGVLVYTLMEPEEPQQMPMSRNYSTSAPTDED